MAGDVGRISLQAGPGADDLSEQPMPSHLACAAPLQLASTPAWASRRMPTQRLRC
jgi:hypothetical protein